MVERRDHVSFVLHAIQHRSARRSACPTAVGVVDGDRYRPTFAFVTGGC